MRFAVVPVYIGVMKSTENDDAPIITVNERPYSSGNSFDSYHWYRTEVKVPVQPNVSPLPSGEVVHLKKPFVDGHKK